MNLLHNQIKRGLIGGTYKFSQWPINCFIKRHCFGSHRQQKYYDLHLNKTCLKCDECTEEFEYQTELEQHKHIQHISLEELGIPKLPEILPKKETKCQS